MTSHLPMTAAEMASRGWKSVDVVFVTGDAYIDHPSFAMALLGRLLEAEGYSVAILSQPSWHNAESWKRFGKPNLCFAISAGNMDSMINHYTAAKKVRNDDAYSPAGEIGLRPDRATLSYCQRAREAYPDVPIIAGGVEASLRRFAHYDYWSDKVRRSIVFDAKADLVVYGMGENPILEILKRLKRGQSIEQCRDIRATAYRLGKKDAAAFSEASVGRKDIIDVGSYELVKDSPEAFAEMTRLIHRETNPYNAKTLVQSHGEQLLVVNPPSIPLTEKQMDRVYGLPYSRKPHPHYGGKKIPAFDVIKTSVQIMRGCFGGCTFCSITAHEGRIIQSRSAKSIQDEVDRMAEDPDFKGVISDIGGPTANMYKMNCSKPAVRDVCKRLSCVHPKICKLLDTDHTPVLEVLRTVRKRKGVKKALVASGIRMDLANRSPTYIKEMAQHHTGGLLKVAPEHADPEVLELMKKPGVEGFEKFTEQFRSASASCGKNQGIVPYFIAAHPGSTVKSMITLAVFLKRTGMRPDKVQDFIPGPMDIATCMFHTGIDPMTKKKIHVARSEKERRMQRALLQYWKPNNHATVLAALRQEGREDLIGRQAHCLVPHRVSKRLPVARGGAGEKNTTGYRQGRSGANRKKKKR